MVYNNDRALLAIHDILVAARWLAWNKAPHEVLAKAFDAAELLPTLLVDPDDETALFRMELEALVELDPQFGAALDSFDGKCDASLRRDRHSLNR